MSSVSVSVAFTFTAINGLSHSLLGSKMSSTFLPPSDEPRGNFSAGSLTQTSQVHAYPCTALAGPLDTNTAALAGRLEKLIHQRTAQIHSAYITPFYFRQPLTTNLSPHAEHRPLIIGVSVRITTFLRVFTASGELCRACLL